MCIIMQATIYIIIISGSEDDWLSTALVDLYRIIERFKAAECPCNLVILTTEKSLQVEWHAVLVKRGKHGEL